MNDIQQKFFASFWDYKQAGILDSNTDNDEYLPIISPDQELMFFTRRLEKESLHSITTTTIEEFVFSKKVNGFFEIGKPLNYPFNIESNEGGASITIDNNFCFF